VWVYVRGVLTCALEAPMPLHSSLVRRPGIPPHCRTWSVHRICATHVTFSFSLNVPCSSHTTETHLLPAELWTTWKRLGNSQMLVHACAGYDVQRRTGLVHSSKRGLLTTASSLSRATLDVWTRGSCEREKLFFYSFTPLLHIRTGHGHTFIQILNIQRLVRLRHLALRHRCKLAARHEPDTHSSRVVRQPAVDLHGWDVLALGTFRWQIGACTSFATSIDPSAWPVSDANPIWRPRSLPFFDPPSFVAVGPTHIGLRFYVHTYYSERDTLSVVAALYGFLFFDKARFLASKRIFSSFFFPVAWPIRV